VDERKQTGKISKLIMSSLLSHRSVLGFTSFVYIIGRQVLCSLSYASFVRLGSWSVKVLVVGGVHYWLLHGGGITALSIVYWERWST